jgi:hypothetical protein
MPENESEFDSQEDRDEEDDRLNEEDDEAEELKRQEDKDDDDEEDDDVYSDDMRDLSTLVLPQCQEHQPLRRHNDRCFD